jgi:predicted transcriptional regulator
METKPQSIPFDNAPNPPLDLIKVLKNPVRLQIYFLLFFYPELNVSEIAQKIHCSKATVSRHLNAMEQAGILESRVSEYKRSITPKYYHLPIERMMEILPFESRAMHNIPKTPQDRLAYYKKSVNAIRAAVYLTQQGLEFLNPLLDGLDNNLEDIHKADEVFSAYFSSEVEKKIDFQTIVISENVLPEYYRLWQKFRKDVEALEKTNKTDHSYIVFETVLPFRRLIEFQKSPANEDK